MMMRTLARTACTLLLLSAVTSTPAAAQVRVNPTGVNVNAQGATTVFLTYGGMTGYQATEALWCGALVAASPATGSRCAPGTIFGQLPLRYERAVGSGVSALTDIMTIPPSVARRAYQDAESGAPSAFYYVRRFESLTPGRPDQYVVVTCRLSGGGARTPLSLTDVRLTFVPDATVLHVAAHEPLPQIEANITYTGTGRLLGRWEIVLPGEELPAQEDLLTEATLPLERRGTQRRYTQLSRFNVLLQPTGRAVLPGPDPSLLPTTTDGVHYLLLRIETTSEKEGDSNLSAVGAGNGVVPSGAVAGFPLPVLRYVVGSGQTADGSAENGHETLLLYSPAPAAALDPNQPPLFAWQTIPHAELYRIELETEQGEPILSALVRGSVAGYRAPPWLRERVAGRPFRWRVVATDAAGRGITRSDWRTATFN